MNPYNVEVQTEGSRAGDLEPLVSQAVSKTLSHLRVQPAAQVTVLLTDDDRIRQLNKEFLGHDEPTDVLSFPAGESMPGADTYLGDIAISLPKATRQAEAGGHGVASEMQLLVVHGTLHLLGYDHSEADDKAEMWRIQGEILEGLGSNLPAPDTKS